jgi:2-polyprenyl-6-hydroxyphenyl methylase / 3-demethylubiquinone-9 3-methyltransferase
MKKQTLKVYNRIDNTIYNTEDVGWWNKDSPLHLIKLLLNPVRIEYIRNNLSEKFKQQLSGKNALEIGCGGGILSEEIAKMGVDVTGIDPSENSIKCAVKHAEINKLPIKYEVATGERVPFKSNYFDIVLCCDVLEHVSNLYQVISEISRVLKPGGIFIYDTINRNLISNLVTIKILQKWKRWAILPSDLHVYNMFIRPNELKSLLRHNNIEWIDHRGIKPDILPYRILAYLHQRAKGTLSYEDFSKKFRLTEGNSLCVSYMGCAIKRDIPSQIP